ncbi:MAG TPA: hypothetical protein VEW08_18280 [Steroidobacteraceae bacterium]|nr:hypothetical protein [Steroidobacteraceae bacterium]
MAAVVRNRFYAVVALALALVVFAGFARTYYFRAWFDVPPITVLLHLHSIAFTAWFVLFIIQTRLIAAQNYRTHMQLGIAGVVLAVIVTILGFATAILSADAPRVRPMGMNSQQFVLVPMVGIAYFAVCVALAISFRRRADLHKRFMMLAMIAVLGPPVARLIFVTQTGKYFAAIQLAVSAAFVAWCLVSDWRKYRIVHPVYAIGGAILLISMPLRAMIARTPQWESVGRWFAGM